METNLKTYIAAIIVFLLSFSSFGHFNNINKAIALRQYDEVIILIEQALEHDKTNPELYYNLGNAYLHTEQYGQALWAYENVINLEPRHENTLKNAQYIYNQLDKGDYEPYLPGFIYSLRNIGSNTFAVIALSGSMLITLILMLSRKYKSPTQYRVAYSLILALSTIIIGSCVLAIYIGNEDEYSNTGVITSPNTPTYLSNFDLAPFQVPLGTRFNLMEQLSDKMWKVKIEDDKTVIIKSDHARLINSNSIQMP